MNAPELSHLSQIRVITYAIESFKIFIFNKLAKMLKTSFLLCHFGVVDCRLMWGGKSYLKVV